MFADSKDAKNMTHEENGKFIVDLFQRITMHQGVTSPLMGDPISASADKTNTDPGKDKVQDR